MKKLSKITEGMFQDAIMRGKNGDVRKEDGEKVTTKIGEVILQNPDFDYNEVIDNMISGVEGYEISILCVRDVQSSFKFEDDDPYNVIILDTHNNNSLFVTFTDYTTILYMDKGFETQVSEHDYLALVKCLTDRLKETSQYLEYIPKNNYILKNSADGTPLQYANTYNFKLADEAQTYGHMCDLDEDDEDEYIDNFLDDIINVFPDLDDEDFIGWSYHNRLYSIGIPLNINTIMHIKEYVEYSKNYFK